jgi:hypothetical protein
MKGRVQLALALTLLLACATGARARVQACEPCLELAPRGSLDGELNVGDLILLQRFAVGLDLPSPDELRRGDLAPARPDEGAQLAGVTPPPFVVIGDGRLGVGDVVLGLRRLVDLLSFDLPPALSLVVATPPSACLGGFVTVWGEGLLVGDAPPSVYIDGRRTQLVHVRASSESRGGFDRLTVREGSGADPAAWESRPVDVRVLTPRGEVQLDEAIELRAACEAAPEILRTEPEEGLITDELRLAGLNLSCLREVVFIDPISGARIPGLITGVHSDNAVDVLPPQVPSAAFPQWELLASGDCGEAWGPAEYRFPDPPFPYPDATMIAPPEGPATGGNTVFLTGTDLALVDEVGIGSTTLDRSDFVVMGNGDLLLPLMPSSPGGPFATVPVPVTVSGGGIADPTPLTYTYLGQSLPECGTIAPAEGGIEGGTVVIITAALGSELDGINRVLFGGLPGTGLIHPNSSQIAVTTPARPVPGSVDVEIGRDGVSLSICPLPFRYR